MRPSVPPLPIRQYVALSAMLVLLAGSVPVAAEITGPTLRAPWQSAKPEEQAAALQQTSERSAQQFSERRHQIDERIRLAQRKIDDQERRDNADEDSQSNNGETSAAQELSKPPKARRTSRELELNKQLHVLLDQQESLHKRSAQLDQDQQTLAEEYSKLQTEGLSETAPFSFLFLESLEDGHHTQEEKVETHEQTVEAAYQNLDRAIEKSNAKNVQRISAAEAARENQDPAKSPEVAEATKVADLELQIAQAEEELQRLKSQNERLALEIEQDRLKLIEKKLAIVRPNTIFTPEDRDKRLLEFQNLETSINREKESVGSDVHALTLRLLNVNAERKRIGDSPALAAEIAALKLAQRASNAKLDQLNHQVKWVSESENLWELRYRLAKEDYESKDLKAWRRDALDLLEELKIERASVETRRQNITKSLATISRELQANDEDQRALRPWLEDRQETLRSQIDHLTNHITRLEMVERLAEKLVNDINKRRLAYNVGEWAKSGWEQVKGVWNYPLAEPDGDARAILVSTVVKGLFLLVIGIWVSRRLSHWLAKSVLPKLGVQEGAAAALQSLAFYAFVLTSALMALKTVHVPLTLFTFLGGAAAIGLGFGSQNILNNFISGIIMLVEQPIRVGDLVELQDLAGTVESIGMRSTRIRTPQNQEMIVPNSTFLENNVQNWTLSDSTIRCQVDVGVAYGSPTREVARWMKQAAEKHGMIRQKPEPFVWFTGFGDNALNFELHFFIVIRTLAERRRIESDLRFMIDQSFRDAGIVIAFPQRDLHLDTQTPLEIRMMPAPEEPKPTPEKPSGIGSPDSEATSPAKVKEAPAKEDAEKPPKQAG